MVHPSENSTETITRDITLLLTKYIENPITDISISVHTSIA